MIRKFTNLSENDLNTFIEKADCLVEQLPVIDGKKPYVEVRI